jgi:KDO2-lipid IV(A) lauroyltransferase
LEFLYGYRSSSTYRPNAGKRYDLNVIFCKVKKIKRGYYEATLIPITDDSKSVPDFGITDAFIKEVEKQIYEAPEYFWTHIKMET